MLKLGSDEIKLIVSDIDGTLLDDNKQIPPKNIEIINQLVQHDIIFSICSGRMPKGFLPIVTQLNRNNEMRYIIGANGAAIYDIKQSNYMYFSSFTRNEVKYLRDLLERHNGYYQICSDDAQTMYFSDESKYEQNYLKKFGGNVDGATNAEILDEKHENIGGCKFTAFFTNEIDFNKFKSDIRQTSNIEVKQISDLACDIVPENNTKWTGILRLINLLNERLKTNYTANNVLYFGDELNDLSVFQHAKYAVAMKNANSIIKKLAYDTCESNNDGGVGQFIEAHLS